MIRIYNTIYVYVYIGPVGRKSLGRDVYATRSHYVFIGMCLLIVLLTFIVMYTWCVYDSIN